ncbi:hypothetical protein I317_01042 [Kwoniella heveanensis CBS 569]|nr:hypothetical protein I317_01042 [Kwoniella heveanensis CBS 569]
MLVKPISIIGVLALLTDSYASDELHTIKIPKDKNVTEYHEGFESMCKLTSTPGEPCIPEFLEADQNDQNEDHVAMGSCTSKIDQSTKDFTADVVGWLGGLIWYDDQPGLNPILVTKPSTMDMDGFEKVFIEGCTSFIPEVQELHVSTSFFKGGWDGDKDAEKYADVSCIIHPSGGLQNIAKNIAYQWGAELVE